MTTLLLLLGCYDFAGDEDRIGFVSDLQTRSGVKWTPEHAIAGGSNPTFYAVAEVGAEDDEELPEVWGFVDELPFEAEEPYVLRVEGPQRGTDEVVFEGELVDHFELRFRPAREVVLTDLVGEELDQVALVASSEVVLGVEVRDRWSRPLGYRLEDLELEADGGVSAWIEEGHLFLVAQEPGGLRLGLQGAEQFAEIELGVPAEVEIEAVLESDEATLLQHRAWTEDGVRLFGVEPAWPEGAEVLGPELATLPRAP